MSQPLVFLHPLAAHSAFWDPVLAELGETHVNIPLDLPGHGRAPLLPRDAPLAQWSRTVLDEIDRLGHQEVVVVGMSLGALVAQHLAVTSPTRVAKAVLVDTVATYPQEMSEMWVSRARVSRSTGTVPFVSPTLDLWFSDEFRHGNSEVVVEADHAVRGTDPEGYARACELLASVDLTDYLPLISCPTLVVCGDDDAPAFVAAAPRLQAAIPNAQLQWLNGRHAVAVERPAEFTAVLLSFLGTGPVHVGAKETRRGN